MSRDRSADHLDEAIDRVAESLTAGEPSAMLRQRVRSRIDGTRTGAHPTRWRAAAALAAMVVLVTFAMARIFLADRSPTESTTNQQRTQPGSFGPVEGKSGREVLGPEPAPAPSPGGSKVLAGLAVSPGFQVAPPDEPAAPPFPWLMTT